MYTSELAARDCFFEHPARRRVENNKGEKKFFLLAFVLRTFIKDHAAVELLLYIFAKSKC